MKVITPEAGTARSGSALVRALLLVTALLLLPSMSAGALPLVLKANSPSVTVRDNGRLLEGVWLADPATALDVYRARRSEAARRVTFITDVDSLAFQVEPGRAYDFTILLNGRDSCHTRISTMSRSGRRIGPDSASGPAIIPIEIRHGKLHLHGTINGSRELDLLFDTGADTNVLYPSGSAKGARLQFDGVATNSGTGGSTVRRTSSDNQLEVAGLRWDHEPVLYVEKQADAADGIVGYPVFDDRVVELDYDRMVMIVHEAMPPGAAGFTRTPMAFAGSLTTVEADLSGGGKRARGRFVLDTGGTGALIVSQAFSSAHDLPRGLRRLGTSRSGGVGSGTIRNQVVMLPVLTLAGFDLPNVPIDLQLSASASGGSTGGLLCMEVLQRFNTFLDYPNGQAYFKPNGRFARPFPARSTGAARLGLTAALVAMLASWAALALRAKRRRGGKRG